MHFSQIDVLRGFAAFSVAYFHLAGSSGLSESISRSGTYGYLGVQIFFVISGFVIPYSLHRRNYIIGDYFIFILKRIFRLDPPYLASIILGIGIGLLGMGNAYVAPAWFRILAHLGYANSFLALRVFEWVNFRLETPNYPCFYGKNSLFIG